MNHDTISLSHHSNLLFHKDKAENDKKGGDKKKDGKKDSKEQTKKGQKAAAK